jgi:hypothetical protein
MKKIFSQTILFLLAAVMTTSCEKDGNMAYVDGFEASDLIASASELNLDVSKRETVVLQLAWNNPTLLSSDDSQPVVDNMLTTYVEVAGAEDFTGSSQTEVTGLTKAYTGTELNTLAQAMGISVNTAGNLYFRIKSTEGPNMTPAYSNVCKVTVTPYFVDMSRMAVLSTNKTDTLAYLNSPEENGIYTGYMNATAWLNCYFYEYSGVTWGNYGESGHAFELSDDDSKWNAWFADGTGQWFVTVDTKALEWKCMLFTQLKVNGNDMTYYSKKKQWGYYITTTSANETFTIEATGHESDKSTGDGAYNEKDVKFALNDGIMTQADATTAATIAEAGTYTIIVEPNDKGEYTYRVEKGEVNFNGDDTPAVVYPTELVMMNKDASADLATLTKTGESTYSCTYTVTADWENFLIVDKENNVYYGSDPSDLYTLSSDDSKWNIWFDEGAKAGDTVTITVDLSTLKWSYTK